MTRGQFQYRGDKLRSICGVASPDGILCSGNRYHDDLPHTWEMEAAVTTYEDMFNQPAPVHNDGPSMHDLVNKDILSRDPQWDLSVGTARHIRDQVADDLDKRKAFGLEKYGTILQTGNGRNFLLDVYQELQDGAVYARGALLEMDEGSLEYLVLFEVYDNIVTDLVKVRRLLNAATE
jgi:hypothetical protein